MAEGLRDALVSRNSATTKHPGPIVWHCLRDPIRSTVFTQYRSVTDTHTETDRRTDRYSIALRGKNQPYCTAYQV